MKKLTAFAMVMTLFVVMMAGTVWANDANTQSNRYYNYTGWYDWYQNWINQYRGGVANQQVEQPQAKQLVETPPTTNQAQATQEVAQTPVAAKETYTSQLTADEQAMITKVNQERTQRGLQPLEVDMRLVKLARTKANDLIVNNYFDHQSPTLGSPFDQMKAAGVKYLYAGENLAGAPNVDRAHTGLMNSPGHRANILKDRYTHIGVGVISGGPYGKMWVQMFIQK